MKKRKWYQTVLPILFVLLCGLWYSRWYERNRLEMHQKEEQAVWAPSEEVSHAVSEPSISDLKETVEQNTTIEQPQETQQFQININTATKEELMLLDGIGEKMAERIIAYRTEYGLFTSLEQLKNVKGIGEKTYQDIVVYITIE